MTLTQTDTPKWQQGSLIEVEITDLSDRADGVGRWNNRVVFVPDTVTNRKYCGQISRLKIKLNHS